MMAMRLIRNKKPPILVHMLIDFTVQALNTRIGLLLSSPTLLLRASAH